MLSSRNVGFQHWTSPNREALHLPVFKLLRRPTTHKQNCCSLPSVFGVCHHQLQEQFHLAMVPAQNQMLEFYLCSQNPAKVQQQIMIN